MLLFLAKCRPLHVGDLLCIYRAPSCARTCSIHSTQTCMLLVTRKVCAYHHFFFSIWGMNSSFENVVLVSPVILWKKINKKLFIYGRFSMMSNTIYEKINVEDRNFANIFRMDRNSTYVFFSKSAESNTSIFPSFGCNIIAIQWFLQKYHIGIYSKQVHIIINDWTFTWSKCIL